MKTIVIRIKQFLVIAVGFVLIGLNSCQTDWARKAPSLPPAESMSMDYSFFESDKSLSTSKSTQGFPTYFNWLGASVTVLTYQGIATMVTAVPVLAYAESFSQEPEKTGDLTWTWSYPFNTPMANFAARLEGTYLNETKVRWEMYVSKDGNDPYTDFLWFEGETVDSTKADWIIYENPEEPNEAMTIAYNKTSENLATLNYTITRPGGNEEGSFIEYGTSDEGDYDRFYNIYKANPDYTVEIEWNSDTKNGRIKNPGYIDDWRCWNEELQDVDCGE